MARIASKSVQIRNSVSSRGQETSLGLKINIPGIQFGQKILNGGYGTVYRGYDITNKRDVAIKVSFNTLKNEYEIMVKLQNIPGVPKVYHYGQIGNSHYIIMELLFHDLQELRFSKSVYTAKTILLIGIQIITILKQIHQKEIIHRDIKPSNIMAKNMSTDGQLYLIDYGISQIINQPVNKTMGTILYDPISVHYQQVYSYIDDLEMLGYTLTYLYKGQLPWANQMIQMNREEKVGRMKQDFLSSRYMNELPFSELFGYIKLFDRTKKPDYDFLLMLFRQMLRRNNLKEDYIYDWTKQFKTGTCVMGRHRLTDFKTEFYETGTIIIQFNNQIFMKKNLSLQETNIQNYNIIYINLLTNEKSNKCRCNGIFNYNYLISMFMAIQKIQRVFNKMGKNRIIILKGFHSSIHNHLGIIIIGSKTTLIFNLSNIRLLDKFYYVWRYNDGREGFQLCGILKDQESHLVINLGWIPVELRDYKHNLANKEYQFKILIKRPEFSDVLKRQEFKGFIDLQQIVKENNLNQETQNMLVDRLGDEGLFEDKLYPYPNQLQRPYLTPETHSAYSTFWGSCTILGLFSIRKLLKM